MRLRDRAGMIPRNNWDYGWRTLFGALEGIRQGVTRAPHVEDVFQQPPIWTKSGRASLYAILKSLNLPPGAQIGVPLFCCSVVFNAIHQAGLTPRFIDSDLDDCNLSIEDLHRKYAGLAAIIAVHMFGHPCDMDAIVATADGLPVIEDCAQSLFSTYKGRLTGLLSTASFFSFRCGKYISAGEGSAVFCRDPYLHSRIQQTVSSFDKWSIPSMVADSLMTFAKATLYHRPWYGLLGHPIGMRLDAKLNLTAKDGFTTSRIAASHLALVDRRIPCFQESISIQREHAHRLLKALEPGSFGLPSEDSRGSTNWFQFALRLRSKDQRDTMAAYLFSQGIDTAKYLDGIADEARSAYGYQGDCPNAELLSKTVLLVPIHYTLSVSDIEHIARCINSGSRLI